MIRRKRKLKSHRLGRGQGPDQVLDRGLDQENGLNPGEGQDQDHENVARGQGLEKDPDLAQKRGRGLGLGGGLGLDQGSDRDLGGAQDLEDEVQFAAEEGSQDPQSEGGGPRAEEGHVQEVKSEKEAPVGAKGAHPGAGGRTRVLVRSRK